MKALVFLSSIALLVFLSGCSSTNLNVVERADDLSDRPDWASVTQPSWEEDGKKYFLGYLEVDGDASKSGALNMSDEKALSEPMRALVDQYLDQNQVAENLRKDSTIGQRIISATRGFRVPMPTLTIVKRYWETAQEDKFNRVLHVYSLAEISISEYEKAKKEYFQRLANNSEMKQILSDVGRRQRDQILGTDSKKN